MAKVVWGIDFGDWSLKVVRGTYDKKADSLVVDLLDEIVYGELPCGYDAASVEKHREAVIAFRNRHEIAPGDDLCVAVSGSEVFSRFINLPPVMDRIDDIIGYEARQQIPFDINDVVWDYQPVKDEHEIGEEIEVGLFALKKERVDELMDLLEPWRANLRVVQNAPLAVYNFLEYEGLADEPAIVVDVGAATTDVLVLNPPRFWVRTLLVAGDDLTNALVEQFGVSDDEAEKIKRRAGKSQHKEQILRILQPVFDDLVNEVQRSLGYYKSLARDVRFERVIAMGSSLKLAGLTQMLAGGLQYQVTGVRELRRLQVAASVDPEVLRSALPGSCAAFGLLVQGAGLAHVNINMVPQEVALASEINRKKPWLLGAAAGLLLAVGALFVGERLYAKEISGAGEGLNWSVKDEADKVTKDVSAVKGQVNTARKALSGLVESGIPSDFYLELLPEFASKFPSDIFLTKMRLAWVEPSAVADLGPISDQRRRVAGLGGPGGPGPGGGGGAEAGARMAAAMAARFSGGGRGPGRISGPGGGSGAPSAARARPGTGGADAGTAAELGPDSLLVLRFACECKRIDKDYVKGFFATLGEATITRPDERPAFRPGRVEMVGDVRDIYRHRDTLAVVSEDAEGAERYLAFEGYAVVNIGPEDRSAAAQEGGATTGRAATSRRSRGR